MPEFQRRREDQDIDLLLSRQQQCRIALAALHFAFSVLEHMAIKPKSVIILLSGGVTWILWGLQQAEIVELDIKIAAYQYEQNNESKLISKKALYDLQDSISGLWDSIKSFLNRGRVYLGCLFDSAQDASEPLGERLDSPVNSGVAWIIYPPLIFIFSSWALFARVRELTTENLPIDEAQLFNNYQWPASISLRALADYFSRPFESFFLYTLPFFAMLQMPLLSLFFSTLNDRHYPQRLKTYNRVLFDLEFEIESAIKHQRCCKLRPLLSGCCNFIFIIFMSSLPFLRLLFASEALYYEKTFYIKTSYFDEKVAQCIPFTYQQSSAVPGIFEDNKFYFRSALVDNALLPFGTMVTSSVIFLGLLFFLIKNCVNKRIEWVLYFTDLLRLLSVGGIFLALIADFDVPIFKPDEHGCITDEGIQKMPVDETGVVFWITVITGLAEVISEITNEIVIIPSLQNKLKQLEMENGRRRGAFGEERENNRRCLRSSLCDRLTSFFEMPVNDEDSAPPTDRRRPSIDPEGRRPRGRVPAVAILDAEEKEDEVGDSVETEAEETPFVQLERQPRGWCVIC